MDTNYFFSDLILSEDKFHHIVNEQIYHRGSKYEEIEFGSDTIFVWEFEVDIYNKKLIEIKYYAIDEILGFIIS